MDYLGTSDKLHFYLEVKMNLHKNVQIDYNTDHVHNYYVYIGFYLEVKINLHLIHLMRNTYLYLYYNIQK
jgi:hypothetical protein